MKRNIKINIFSGTVGTVLDSGVGYAVSSGDCFTTAVVAACGCAIGALMSVEINQKKKIKKLEKTAERLNADIILLSRHQSYCFAPGTLVMTENGYKNIEDIAEGDLAYSYNMETKTKELKKVVRTFVNEGEKMLTISVNDAKMELTPNHTCYVNGDWCLASDIKVGDKMIDCDSNELVVENVKSVGSCEKVYNIEVKDNHNYFVTNLNALVHNDSTLF